MLRRLGGGARLSYHIPDRFDEGYGLSVRAAEKAAADGVGLLLTADIGVRDHAAVAAARAGGVDVLVLD
ncbi:MAG: single-stranded-DNA-specific exonuclease RecJ, partial [bacterium]